MPVLSQVLNNPQTPGQDLSRSALSLTQVGLFSMVKSMRGNRDEFDHDKTDVS